MLAKPSVIYEPRGKAREYAPLAVNLYHGCGHRCEYCYVPSFIRTTKEKFREPEPRKGIKTWASLEPVLYPEVTLEIIRQTHTWLISLKLAHLTITNMPGA